MHNANTKFRKNSFGCFQGQGTQADIHMDAASDFMCLVQEFGTTTP